MKLLSKWRKQQDRLVTCVSNVIRIPHTILGIDTFVAIDCTIDAGQVG